MTRAMKDSGVEWIGKIPQEWSCIKFKYLFSIIGGNGFPDALQGADNGDYPFCKVSDINGVEIEVRSAANYVSEDVAQANKFNIIPINSILMAKIGAALSKNHRKINTVPCCIDNNTQALVARRDDCIKYLYYLTTCIDMSWFDNKSTVPSINNQKLLSFWVPNVTSCEQRRIADFLDRRCAEIDRVIAATEQTIAEYKALKQSIITEAVTKGVRGPRPMKDSGVEWIGEIPAEWDMCRLKQICSINGRIGFRGYTQEDLVDEGDGAITLSPSNIVEMQCQFNKCSYISWFKYDESPEIQIGVGDILFVKTGSSYGKSGIVDHLPEKATINPQLIVARATTISSKLLLYMLQSSQLQYQVQQSVVGGTIPTIAQSKILNYSFPLPYETEQQEIIDHLDIKCQEIDQMIKTKQQLLTELEAYKKSVIYEFVTGKKEVD